MAFFHFCNCHLVCQNAINIWIYDDVAVVNIFVYQYLFMKLFGWGSVRFKNVSKHFSVACIACSPPPSSPPPLQFLLSPNLSTAIQPCDPPKRRSSSYKKRTHTEPTPPLQPHIHTIHKHSVCCDTIIYINRERERERNRE